MFDPSFSPPTVGHAPLRSSGVVRSKLFSSHRWTRSAAVLRCNWINAFSSHRWTRAAVFRCNWINAFSIISQGLDASSKAAPHLLHQTHRVWMPHRCCTLLKAARYASGCVGFVTRLTPTADLVMRFTPQLAAAAHCSKQRGTQAAASICNAVDSGRRFGNAVDSAVSRCCPLHKAARHTSGCVNL